MAKINTIRALYNSPGAVVARAPFEHGWKVSIPISTGAEIVFFGITKEAALESAEKYHAAGR